MGLFSRTKNSASQPPNRIIPLSQISQLEDVGRKVFDSPPQYVDVSNFYLPGLQAAGFPTTGAAWDDFVDAFVAELSDGGEQIGGWANAGAFHVAKDFVKSEDWQKPNLVSLMDQGLRFLAKAGVDGGSIPHFAISRFIELKRQQA